jgi:ankyrin repeat protein
MLAAWSGSLETVKVLVEYGNANPHAINVEGYSAAHFAASAGHLHVCQYLHAAFGMDFVHAAAVVVDDDPNNTSNSSSSDDVTNRRQKLFTSPLQSAMAYNRKDVVEWIQKTFLTQTASSSSS